MFWIKIQRMGMPLQTPFHYAKVRYEGVHVYIARTCLPDDKSFDLSPQVTVQVLPIYPTTTTTTTTAAYPDVYDAITDYFGDTGNLIWTILACLLGALFLGLLAYTCARCLSTPGACAAFR